MVTLNWPKFVHHGKSHHLWAPRLILLLGSISGINPKKCPSLGQVVQVNVFLLMSFIGLITPWILLYLISASLVIIIGGNSLPIWLNTNICYDYHNISNVISHNIVGLIN